MKRLELNCKVETGSDFKQMYETIKGNSGSSAQTFCVNFHNVHNDRNVHGIEVVSLPSVHELGFIRCRVGESGLLGALVRGLSNSSHLVSLRKLQLSKLYDGLSLSSEFRSLYGAIFSMPKQQLAEFTLDLSDNYFDSNHHHGIIDIWKDKSDGQKLKRLIYTRCYYVYEWTQPGRQEHNASLCESFRSLAVDVEL